MRIRMKPALFFGAAALSTAAAAAWWSARVPPAAVAVVPPAIVDPSNREHSSAAASLSVPAASAQVPFAGAGAGAGASAHEKRAGGPEINRLEQRRLLYEAVDALLQVSEFERARQLLDEDQERYADELGLGLERDLAQGYRLIADCLEQPNALHRTRGQAFLLVNEARTLNAKLRVACAPE